MGDCSILNEILSQRSAKLKASEHLALYKTWCIATSKMIFYEFRAIMNIMFFTKQYQHFHDLNKKKISSYSAFLNYEILHNSCFTSLYLRVHCSFTFKYFISRRRLKF